MNGHEEAIARGIEGARKGAVDLTPVPAVVTGMLAERPSGFAWRTPLRLAAALAAAGALALVALYPRPSLAAVLRAVRTQPARFEEVLKPDANGHFYVYFDQWGEGDKYANRMTDGSGETRADGHLVYNYWNFGGAHYQRVDTGQPVGIDSVGVEEFISVFKLLRVENAGPHLERYEFNIHQDLLVDTTTNLPTERVVYNDDGTVMEIHRYRFFAHLDARIFEPDIKPGATFYDIPQDRRRLAAMVAEPPQRTTVAGVSVSLYAVIVGRGGRVGAIVSGGDPRGTTPAPLQIVGLPAGTTMPMPDPDDGVFQSRASPLGWKACSSYRT